MTLANSPHYKFVHVGDLGQVSSYDAKTSFGERQHLTWIPAQGAQVVYIPVVPTKLGDIDVTIQAKSLIRKEQVNHTLFSFPVLSRCSGDALEMLWRFWIFSRGSWRIRLKLSRNSWEIDVGLLEGLLEGFLIELL